MIRAGVVGLGKMGLSHLAVLGANPQVEVAAVCDSNTYLTSVLNKNTGVEVHHRLESMISDVDLDAVIIATPSRLHEPMVRTAIQHGLHVFCEKPFCLDTAAGAELARAAQEAQLVTQVGYHNRFVGTFQEVKRLLDRGAVGTVTHVLAEAYGPVVLRAKGRTWRTSSTEGGGCLYDYAAHPINLVNWYLGAPVGVKGTQLNRIFSADTDDEVVSTLHYPGGTTAQISVSWSDESVRKMSTRLTIWGTAGGITVDRQECRVYLRSPGDREAVRLDDYRTGWNIKYITDLTEPVDFYLRGEEYSAELDHFVTRCLKGEVAGENSFDSAVVTDRTIDALVRDSRAGASTPYLAEEAQPAVTSPDPGLRSGFRRLVRRARAAAPTQNARA